MASVNTSRIYVDLVRLFCSLQVYRSKLLGYHWNVRGEDFYQRHLLFERLYGEVDGVIDRMAEIIRKFGVAPAAFSVYLKFSVVMEDVSFGSGENMIAAALADLPKLYEASATVYEEVSGSEPGVENLMGDIFEMLDRLNYLLTFSS